METESASDHYSPAFLECQTVALKEFERKNQLRRTNSQDSSVTSSSISTSTAMQSMISEDKPQANSRGQDSDYDFINAADCVDSGVAASEPHGSRKARNSLTSSSMQKNTKPPLSLTLLDSL